MKKPILAGIVLGFIGAVLAYLPYVGYREVPYLCPICPHVTMFGEPYTKFLRLTIVFGSLNALLFVAFACGGVALVTALRRR